MLKGEGGSATAEPPSLLSCRGETSGDEERGVSVAEKTVVGGEGVVIDAMPVVADESPDEE